jgi:hypothetical protein
MKKRMLVKVAKKFPKNGKYERINGIGEKIK